MREILFRGKRLDNGEWVYGSFIPDMTDLSGKSVMCDWGFIKPFGKTKEEWEMQYVEKETVGQFTSLTDKNGKRIFEGDIVTYNNGLASEIFEVVYNEKWARFAFTKPNTVFAVFNTAKCEVVGNVHDSPRLLEGGEDNG